MGTLYKRAGSRKWMMAVTVAGRQRCKSTHTSNKRLADQMLSRWEAEVFEGRFQLPKSNPPRFEAWADDFLQTVSHPNTRRRYTSSVGKLKSQLKGLKLIDISVDRIEEYKDARLASGVGPATVNRDLAVLRRMLRLAERKRFITRSPFVEVELLEERKHRRAPHIVTFEEEEKILAAALPHVRALMVLILETGMRSNREALALGWENVDFDNSSIRVRESKTRAGVRNVPLSAKCKGELLRWRNIVGPEFSPWVFPNMRNPDRPLKDIRRSWAKALKDAKLEYFWIYNLRHTFASRLSAAGVSDLFVAQMMGHSSPSILQTYAKAIDEYRRDAICKLEAMRNSHRPRPRGENLRTFPNPIN
jgi:integrase